VEGNFLCRFLFWGHAQQKRVREKTRSSLDLREYETKAQGLREGKDLNGEYEKKSGG
jgi:hypothetical protein